MAFGSGDDPLKLRTIRGLYISLKRATVVPPVAGGRRRGPNLHGDAETRLGSHRLRRSKRTREHLANVPQRQLATLADEAAEGLRRGWSPQVNGSGALPTPSGSSGDEPSARANEVMVGARGS